MNGPGVPIRSVGDLLATFKHKRFMSVYGIRVEARGYDPPSWNTVTRRDVSITADVGAVERLIFEDVQKALHESAGDPVRVVLLAYEGSRYMLVSSMEDPEE